ncbi:MAG TPA: hypothetical protein VND93_04765 [Myxococcales bacterium]|nr:hypothetical protein [Myxococcales bacterium]
MSGDPAGTPDPLDRAGRLRRRRRERLMSLLPRLLAAQPEGSVLGSLVDALAGRLAELDQATERVLRDRWMALAGASPRWDDGPSPLEMLGRLLEISQEPWEELEAYRRRLRQVAPILLAGSSTVRSLLAVGAASLDTELCPRLRRLPDTDAARAAGIQDTTLGLGVRPGTRASCPECELPGDVCPYENGERLAARGAVAARLQLTDCPATTRNLHLLALGHDSRFQVVNPSLALDRPVVTLAATTRLAFPALHNVESNEVMLFAGTLEAGETLVLSPARFESDVRPFDGYTPQGPALDFLLAPGGSAVLQGGTTTRNVAGQMYYLQGVTYGEARFGHARFSLLGQHVLSPGLDAGANTWRLRGYTQRDVQAIADKTLLAGLAGAPALPFDGVADARGDLTLDWWVRLPATFRLRIPEMPARPTPQERTSVLDLTRRSVEAARAAGVLASVDFPEPPRREKHPLGEGALRLFLRAKARESQPEAEALKAVQVTARGTERQPEEDRRGLSVLGKFDVTRFEWSHLGTRPG